MGIAFVLVIWGVIGSVLACIGALVLRWMAGYFTRGANGNRRDLLRSATLFPVQCLGWAGLVFVFQAAVNVSLLHRDVGLGDGFDCPLPDGYALSFIDETDIGTLYNAKNYSLWSDVRDNAVDDVRLMQLAGPYVLGGSDTKRFEHPGEESTIVDSWFLLDTRTDKRSEFKSYDDLRRAARGLKIQSNLAPIGNFYSKFRLTWFDAFAGVLLVMPPLLRMALLVRTTLRVRKTRDQRPFTA